MFFRTTVTPIALLTLILITPVFAQNPADYHLIFGNRDASPIIVAPGDTIYLPIWGATNPDPLTPDSVVAMENGLATNDLYIVQRLDGDCELCTDDTARCKFSIVSSNQPTDGYTSQSQFYMPLMDPYSFCYISTGGDTTLLGFMKMLITADSSLMGLTILPFRDPGRTIWSMQSGLRWVAPTISYSPLYISNCFFTYGDANGDGTFDGRDIVFAVNFLKGLGPQPPYSCECPGYDSPKLAADANGDCNFSGIDVTFSVNYLKGVGPAPRRCPGC